MTDELLVRYLLDDLAPTDRVRVETAARSDAAVAGKLGHLRAVLRGLADHDHPAPPPGLADATVAHTAGYLVANNLFRFDPDLETPAGGKSLAGRAANALRWTSTEPIFFGGWRRADVAVAFTLGFLAAGLGLGAIGKLRADSQVKHCQANLQQLHAALSGYADTHGGRLPQVGTPTVPVAADVANELARAGQLWAPSVAGCPAVFSPETPAETADARPPTYAYTLGYRLKNGHVLGARLGDGPGAISDLTPIAADSPWSPHARGQNVLLAGGVVRFTDTPAAGVNGDDIYRNDAGLVRAGLHKADVALGTGDAVP
ncbi:MAG: hypothetical protein ACRC7O_07960 [Fimbriiglobus sp.]